MIARHFASEESSDLATAAFISYAREDGRIAAALQTGLIEMARANPRGGPGGRLRVIRDTTHLIPGQALSEALRLHLVASDKLIILASPYAARSPWVRMEILTFVEVRGAADIIVVLTDGELVWDDKHLMYSMRERNAFPDLGRSIFPAEPLHLDLRVAAASKSAPTLREDSFRDAVATLLVAIVGGRKDDLVGEYVDTYRRTRAQLLFNLGFRGAVGFALAALVTALASPLLRSVVPSQRELTGVGLASGIALSAALCGVGAFACRLGFRGYLATIASFLVAVPFYASGTLPVFDDSVSDKIGLAATSLMGFCCAGIVFGRMLPQFKTSRLVTIFGLGGLLGSIPFLLIDALRDGFENLRQVEATSQIFAVPWLFDRLALATHALPEVVSSIPAWTVAIACAALIGALLGREQARSEMPALTSAPGRPLVQVIRRLWKRVAIGGVMLAGTSGLYLCSAWNQAPSIAADLNPVEVEKNVGSSSMLGESAVRRLAFGFQARDALQGAGKEQDAQKLTGLIHQWIRAQFEAREDRYVVIPGFSESLQAHLGEAEPILQKAIADVGRDSEQLALLARVARRMGARGVADSALNSALTNLSASSGFGTRMQVAVALVEAARIPDATALLGTDLQGIPCNEDVAQTLWVTGVWQKIPDRERQGWSCNAAVAAPMIRSQDWEEGLELLRTAQHLLGVWETSILAAVGAAADQGRFDIAQRAADLLRKGQGNWATYAESQRAIGDRAAALHDEHTFAEAEANLGGLLNEASGSYYDYRTQIELSYWKMEFAAGRYDKAAGILEAMSDSHEKADATIAVADAELRKRQPTLAKRTLARAWRVLHTEEGYVDPPCEQLEKISRTLLSLNERLASRTLAEECRPWRFEEDWLHRYSALAAVLAAYVR